MSGTMDDKLAEVMVKLQSALDSIPSIVRSAISEHMQQAPRTGPLLTREELCAALHTSESTLKRWDRAGCPRVDLGERSPRYSLDDVIAWRKEQADSRRSTNVSVSAPQGIRALSRKRR